METMLGCLFALFIGFFLFSWMLLRQGVRFFFSLFGLKWPDQSALHEEKARQQAQNKAEGQQQQASSSASNGKIFQKDESEYVDFEDVP